MPVVDGNWVAPDKAFLRGGLGMVEKATPKAGKPMYLVESIRKWVNTPIHQISLARGVAMDIELHAVEVSGAAEDALKSLKESLDKFKSTLANDLTAIKAASTRVQNETQQMKRAYQETQAMLTTPEFAEAVSNAERMAVALKAIGDLSDTKLSVSLFAKGE